MRKHTPSPWVARCVCQKQLPKVFQKAKSFTRKSLRQQEADFGTRWKSAEESKAIVILDVGSGQRGCVHGTRTRRRLQLHRLFGQLRLCRSRIKKKTKPNQTILDKQQARVTIALVWQMHCKIYQWDARGCSYGVNQGLQTKKSLVR